MTLPQMIDPKAIRQMEPHEYNIRVWADKQAIEVIDRQKDHIRALEEALHKAFNQFENITVADDLKTAHDRAHAFIGWAYQNIPGYTADGEAGK